MESVNTNLQDIADKAAQDYNAIYNPTERAKQKGYDGVTETANGGVSFYNSDYMYVLPNGEKVRATIEATGNRRADFDAANAKYGFTETPDGYVWHHLDDYNVSNNNFTIELFRTDAHNASKPHAGTCAQYDAVHGSSYNPPKKKG